MQYEGIDVSVWNGVIDWQKVAASGKRFAMLRAGIGAKNGGFTADSRFLDNLLNATAAGILCGAYLYSYALTEAAARIEAEQLLLFLASLRDKIRFPVAYDIEDKSQSDLSRQTLTAMANAFCSTVRREGYRPMVYSNLNWLKNNLIAADIAADIWLAQWSRKPTYTGDYRIWQYSATGSVDGIQGAVDLDVADTLFEKVQTPEEAIVRLQAAGVLNRPEYWQQVIRGERTASQGNVGELLIKMADLL